MASGTLQQSCRTCEEYVYCAGVHIIYMPCPGGTEWDDVQKVCVMQGDSTTCTQTTVIGEGLHILSALT